MCSCSLKLFLLVLILSIAFWIVKFLDCYEPTWANLSQLEPTCGPKWPNGAAHAHAYCIIRAGNGNCWASVSATINLYFKHVTCSQDTFKMASSTQTRKIHVPIGLWIFMVIIVRTAGSKLRCDSWYVYIYIYIFINKFIFIYKCIAIEKAESDWPLPDGNQSQVS